VLDALQAAMTLHPDLPTMSQPLVPMESGQMVIGVSIMIPEPWGAELQDWRSQFGDPLAGCIPPHVTLLPPTAVEREDLEDISTHLARVAMKLTPFELMLQGTGTFRPVSPVVFVKLGLGAGGCDRLQRLIRSGPLVRDLSFPYHPHVTVAHNVPEPNMDRAMKSLDTYRVNFTVTEFGLFEQGSEGVWRQQRRYPFGDGRH
jgi:2'-5' RNA ligase